MAKKVKKKAEKTAVELGCERVGMNLGALIRTWFQLNPEIYMIDIANLLGLTKMAFYHKLNSPHYGTTLDILQLSLVTKHDFITPILSIYKNNGNPVQSLYTEAQVNVLQTNLETTQDLLKRCQRETDRLHKILSDKD
jgi:hypothetical protein